MKLALGLDLYRGAALDVPVDQVRMAEDLGYHSVWTAEAWGSDAATPLAWVAAQTTRIFEIIGILLAEAGMRMTDVVKMITYLVDVADQPAYAAARKPFFDGCSPAMTMVGVSQLASPAIRVEVEVIAARHD